MCLKTTTNCSLLFLMLFLKSRYINGKNNTSVPLMRSSNNIFGRRLVFHPLWLSVIILAGIFFFVSALFISNTWLWCWLSNLLFLLMLHSSVQRRLHTNYFAASVNSVGISILSCKYLNINDFKLFHYLRSLTNTLKHINVHKSFCTAFVSVSFFVSLK